MRFMTPLAVAFLLAVLSFSTVGCGEAETKPAPTTSGTTEGGSDEKAEMKKEAGSEKKEAGSGS